MPFLFCRKEDQEYQRYRNCSKRFLSHRKRKEEKMSENRLFDTWTMETALPEPFQKILKENGGKKLSINKEDCSCYNPMIRGKSAKLHPPTLQAILQLMQIMEGSDKGAAGVQRSIENTINYYCLEYQKEDGRCVMVYNRTNGSFKGCKIAENYQHLQTVSRGSNTGEEYLAVLAYASIIEGELFNQEFKNNFEVLRTEMINGWKHSKKIMRSAFICCDNLYRRISSMDSVQGDAIPLEQEQLVIDGVMKYLPPYLVKSGIYSPNQQIYGKFTILSSSGIKKEQTIAELKSIYQTGWTVSEESRKRIPKLPESYQVSISAQNILESIVKTPARLFMMTGGAGVGKTTDARIIAQVLRVPYYCFTCGPETDEMTLLASMIPNMRKKPETEPDLPIFEDMLMDPASALAQLSGHYENGIESNEAFQKILSTAFQKGYEAAKAEKDFLLVESEIIQACREPSVIEIQEPSSIEKPGTLTRLNSLFDDGASTNLLNGEIIRRHPDTIVIMTTNLNYIGCQMFNESVLSRMNVIQHRGELTKEQMIIRAIQKTDFHDTELMEKMASIVLKIHAHLIREDMQGGVCGYREFENWIWSYMVTRNIVESVKDTVLSKAALLEEDRKELLDTYVLPYFEAA